MSNRRNYKVSTRASTLRAAMEQLKRFEAEPENHDLADLPHEQPIYLDAPLTEEILLWSWDTKKNSREWLEKQQHYLAVVGGPARGARSAEAQPRAPVPRGTSKRRTLSQRKFPRWLTSGLSSHERHR